MTRLRDSAEFEGIVLLFVETIMKNGRCRISDREEFADAVDAHLGRAALPGHLQGEARRPQPGPDEDGDCLVCGLPFEGDAEEEGTHECPPGFTSHRAPTSAPTVPATCKTWCGGSEQKDQSWWDGSNSRFFCSAACLDADTEKRRAVEAAPPSTPAPTAATAAPRANSCAWRCDVQCSDPCARSVHSVGMRESPCRCVVHLNADIAAATADVPGEPAPKTRGEP